MRQPVSERHQFFDVPLICHGLVQDGSVRQ